MIILSRITKIKLELMAYEAMFATARRSQWRARCSARQAEKQPAASAGTSTRAHDGDSDSRRSAEIGAKDVGKARVAGTTKEQRAAKV
jgi:hypothetical protein